MTEIETLKQQLADMGAKIQAMHGQLELLSQSQESEVKKEEVPQVQEVEQRWINLTNMHAVSEAKVEGWEIELDEFGFNTWAAWDGETWNSWEIYRGRPKAGNQPKKVAAPVEPRVWHNASIPPPRAGKYAVHLWEYQITPPRYTTATMLFDGTKWLNERGRIVEGGEVPGFNERDEWSANPPEEFDHLIIACIERARCAAELEASAKELAAYPQTPLSRAEIDTLREHAARFRSVIYDTLEKEGVIT